MIKVGFLGGGNMAQAMVGGLVKTMDARHIVVCDRNEFKRDRLQENYGIVVKEKIGDWLNDLDLLVLAVKPQAMAEAVEGVNDRLKEGVAILCIAAGIPMSRLSQWFAQKSIIRAMPNTPALVGEGMTGLYAPMSLPENHKAWVESVIEATGHYLWVAREEDLDVVIGLSGSGPAYVFKMIESLVKAGVKRGFTPAQSEMLVKQMVYGAAALAIESEDSPALLREKVTSKGGTTAKALEAMEQYGVDTVFEKAVDAAIVRAQEMAREH